MEWAWWWGNPQRTVRDDRGAPRLVEPLHQVLEQVVDERIKRRAPWWTVLGVVPGAIGLVVFTRTAIENPGDAALIVGVVVVGLVVAIPLGWLIRRRATPRQVPVDVATLVAHGRCGCCGWGIRDCVPAVDGCISCPECGAAWHRSRFTLISYARHADEIIHEILAEQFMQRAIWSAPTDDRCVAMKIEGLAPVRAAERDPYEMAHRSEIVEERVSDSGSSIRWGGTIGLCVLWMGVMIASKWISPRDPGAVVSAAVFLGCVVGVPVLLLVWRVQLPWVVRRRSILELGVCPACLASLDPANAGFDGCVACEVCGRAWDAKDIRPLAEFPPLSVPCDGCGYDRAGLEACPECGMRTDGTFLPRTAHPVCARCGTDLPGENRACPKCGVMAGVEYM